MKYIVVLDLETTGLDKRKDRVIEVACIKFDAQTFEEREIYHTFVNPEREIPQLISQITQITQSDIEDAPIFLEIKQDIQNFIGDAPILGHNTLFDKDFLIAHGIFLENNLVLDTFYFANFLLWDIKSLNLEHICGSLGIELLWSHRAINDARATLYVYRALIEKMKQLSFFQKTIFWYVTQKSISKIWNFLEETYEIKQTVSEALFAKEFFKITSWEDEKYDEKPSFSSGKESLESIFASFSAFESRPNQQEMSHIVQKNFHTGWKIAIEAPTWVGKTFAYLIPAILYTKEFSEQVFISTSTKALQDQIFWTDLDFLEKNLPFSFSYTKLKGKKNYFWVYNFFQYFGSEQQHSIEKTIFFLKILFCLEKNTHGELDILDYYGEEYGFLHFINASSAFSLSVENPYIQYEYIAKARKRAQTADIVIINNHILFQDIFSGGKILGWVKNLVIDEAHNLEDVVTQALKKRLSIPEISEIFLILEKVFQKEKDFDISPFLLKKEQFIFEVSSLLEMCRSHLFSKISIQSQYKILLVRDDFYLAFPHSLIFCDTIQLLGKDLLHIFSLASEKLLQIVSPEITALEDILSLLSIFASGEKRRDYIFTFLFQEPWIIFIEYTILNPASFLQKQLWSKLDSVLLTSATLKIGDNYTYIQNMYHLFDFDFFTLGTDFDYKKQALVVIPTNLGSVKNNFPRILDFLGLFFASVKGQTMVLFTSFQSIRDTYTGLSQSLKTQWISLLAQWVSGSKQKQIAYFKKHSKNSILLGTDSFWEGIDIPGDDLRYLIIHKIPFMVPTDPIFQARSILFKDAFQDYSIPKAILKLKQGFGRLIRSKTDTWIMIFLDDRIVSCDWGREFLKSFPLDIQIKYTTTEKLFEILEK
jgi:predicted DnaQ family exonuclease/DinG family helicase